MMRIGLVVLLMVCFWVGCAKVKPSTPETGVEKLPAAGPPVKKFCVVGPGFENKKCLQDAPGELPGR